MRKRLGFAAPTVAFFMLVISPVIGRAQTAPPANPGAADAGDQHVDGWGRLVPSPEAGKTPGPAPRHDIFGTWEPAAGWRNGVQASGAYNYQIDGKHSQVPFTPAGEQAWKTHKYGDGGGSYALTEVNDPFEMCDPIGFPRVDLHDLRAIQFVQTPNKVLVTYENDQVWRTIWTDGRSFPTFAFKLTTEAASLHAAIIQL